MRDPDLPGEQAQVVMWLEIFDKIQRDKIPIWDISPSPVIVTRIFFKSLGIGASSHHLGDEGRPIYGY